MSFVNIDSIEKLDKLFEASTEKPILLFKHSITCPISTDASNQMSIVNGDVNIVIVQSSREISNAIAQRTNIQHESPQAIIIKDRKPIFQASHYNITTESIEQNLK
jgi:bacillithiol system protein YtxJ